MKLKTLAAAVPAILLIGPMFAHAASVYLDPASGKFPPGVAFGVDVRLDNQGECINAAEVTLSYPKDVIEAVDVSEGNSIFPLWVKDPTIYKDYGLISFIGGLPGGYCGRVSGDTSLSNKLATVYFRFPTSSVPVATGTIPIIASLNFVSGTRAVLNDGLGTLAKLSLGNATYTLITKGQYAPESAWENLIQSDTQPPEPFKVGVYRDQSLFGNSLFAVFSTVDKQTGVDHYEVAEVPTKDLGLPENEWKWARAVSPYLVKNQTLDGTVEVRAIDKAGNERIESYSMQKLPPTPDWRLSLLPYFAMISIIGAAIGTAIFQIIIRLL